MSVNKVLLIGNLGKDPEVRFTGSGQAVARFPVATSEVWNDKRGPAPGAHRVAQRRGVGKAGARPAASTSQKGRQVYVEGSIRTRQYDDKDGNKRYITEVDRTARPVPRAAAAAMRRRGGRDQGASEDMPPAPLPEDDDIPF